MSSEEAEPTIHLNESTFLSDPLGPDTSFLSDGSVFPGCSFFRPPRASAAKTRPQIWHILRSFSQITAIKRFPFVDSFAIGTLNAAFAINHFNRIDLSILFEPTDNHQVHLIDIHPCGLVMACNGRSWDVQIASLGTGALIYNCNQHKRPVTSMYFAVSFNKIASSSLDGSYLITDLIKRQPCYSYSTFVDIKSITASALRQDETVIAMAFSDGIISLCDHRQAGDFTEIKAHASWINSVEFGVTDTYFGTAGIDRSLKIYDLRNLGEPVFAEKELDSSLKKVMFANDNTVFGVRSDGGITQWNIPEQAVYANLGVKRCGIVACDIFVENRWLVFSGEDAVLSVLSY